MAAPRHGKTIFVKSTCLGLYCKLQNASITAAKSGVRVDWSYNPLYVTKEFSCQEDKESAFPASDE